MEFTSNNLHLIDLTILGNYLFQQKIINIKCTGGKQLHLLYDTVLDQQMKIFLFDWEYKMSLLEWFILLLQSTMTKSKL